MRHTSSATCTPEAIFAEAVAGTRGRESAGAECPHSSGAEQTSEVATQGASLPGGGRVSAPRAQTRLRTSRAARRCYATGRPGNAPPGRPPGLHAGGVFLTFRTVQKSDWGPPHQLRAEGSGGGSLSLLRGTRRRSLAWHLRGRWPFFPPRGGATWRPAHCGAVGLTRKWLPGQVMLL